MISYDIIAIFITWIENKYNIYKCNNKFFQ